MKVGGLREEEKEFPMVLVRIGAGVGVVLFAGILLALVCALRKKQAPCKADRKGPRPRFERNCLIRMQEEHPLNPYNDAENIYEEAEAVYSTAERGSSQPPSPGATEGEWPRTQVFVRQSSRC